MPDTEISSASVTDQASAETEFSVSPETTDGAQDQKETEYINDRWTQQLAYYKKIPELKSAIDSKARWTIGKGFKSNEITEMALSEIKGHGKDTFNTILENQTRVKEIGGDSFAEIIRESDTKLLNLKPLSPEFIKIIVNKQGIITRYEQINRPSKSKIKRVFAKVTGRSQFLRFSPEEIFHLSRNRTADEIHGDSMVDAVEDIILARNEAITDYRILLRRNVKPIKIWEVDTDDTTEIAEIKAKIDTAGADAENLIIPKGSVLPPTISSVPSNATLNPLPWINRLTNDFYQFIGVPQIINGGSIEITEASAKIAYLAFEQTIEEEQLYLEEQVRSQLNLEIELEFPATLQNELLSDSSKSETTQASTPEDTNVQDVGVSPSG